MINYTPQGIFINQKHSTKYQKMISCPSRRIITNKKYSTRFHKMINCPSRGNKEQYITFHENIKGVFIK